MTYNKLKICFFLSSKRKRDRKRLEAPKKAFGNSKALEGRKGGKPVGALKGSKVRFVVTRGSENERQGDENEGKHMYVRICTCI